MNQRIAKKLRRIVNDTMGTTQGTNAKKFNRWLKRKYYNKEKK